MNTPSDSKGGPIEQAAKAATTANNPVSPPPVAASGGVALPKLTESPNVVSGGHALPTDPGGLADAAQKFMIYCGMTPTPDAVGQLLEVFVPCLQIMTERPWDPNGKTWRKSGILGVATDSRKKFERFWERLWGRRVRHDDSGYDLINYVGFVMRSDQESGWGEWGEPGEAP